MRWVYKWWTSQVVYAERTCQLRCLCCGKFTTASQPSCLNLKKAASWAASVVMSLLEHTSYAACTENSCSWVRVCTEMKLLQFRSQDVFALAGSSQLIVVCSKMSLILSSSPAFFTERKLQPSCLSWNDLTTVYQPSCLNRKETTSQAVCYELTTMYQLSLFALKESPSWAVCT